MSLLDAVPARSLSRLINRVMPQVVGREIGLVPQGQDGCPDRTHKDSRYRKAVTDVTAAPDKDS